MSSGFTSSSWSEARLHRWLAKRFGRQAILSGSPMHDAACLRPFAGRPTLCTDQTIEGVHFESGVSGRRVGQKAAARVLSDLAATGARPYAITLCVSAGRSVSETYLRSVIEGSAEMAERFRAHLVCGDLSCTENDPLHVSVCGLGSVRGRTKPVGRDRAKPGQLVLLSGPVGGSSLGRHLRIEPRVSLGEALAGNGATCMMDVSDGLALDLSRIAAASRVRIDLELGHLPIHADAHKLARRSGATPLEHALYDGEDHELIATMTQSSWSNNGAALARRFPGLQVIGHVRRAKSPGLWLLDADSAVAPRPCSGNGGWLHGK